MLVKEMMEKLDLEQVAGTDLNKEVEGGFVGDLLSVVMSNSKENQVWVTIQSHINIVAIASLVNLSCIIVTEGFQVDEDAIQKANEEDVVIFTSKKSSYGIAKDLAKLGV